MPRFYYGWMIAIAGFLLSLNFAFFTSYGIFLLPILKEFDLSTFAGSLASSFALLSYSANSFPSGWMVDRFGPRYAGLLGTALISIGLVISGYASNILELYLSYGAIAGAGLAFVSNAGGVAVVKWFVDKRRATAVGIMASGSAVGSLVFPPLIQLLIIGYSWRIAFVVCGILACLISLIATLILRKKSNSGNINLELMNSGENNPIEHLMTPRQVLKTSMFWVQYVAFLLGALSLFALTVYVVPYLIEAGEAPLISAGALTMVGVGSLSGRAVLGKISGAMGTMNALSLVYLLLTIGILAIIASSVLQVAYSACIVIGFSYGGFVAANIVATREHFGGSHFGSIWGIMTTSFGIGGMIGPSLGGAIYDAFGDYHLIFLLAVGLSVIASGLIFFERRSR